MNGWMPMLAADPRAGNAVISATARPRAFCHGSSIPQPARA